MSVLDPPAAEEAQPPLPGSVSWFAPWRWCQHWRPWKRWMVVGAIAVAGYVLSPVLVVPVTNRFGPTPIQTPLMIFYTPLRMAYEHIPVVGWAYDVAFESGDQVMNACFGYPTAVQNAPLPTPPVPPLPPQPGQQSY